MSVRVPATKRSQRTRSELAKAAHDQVSKHGSLDAEAVALAAGVSTATFYSHFASHDNAIAAALDLALIKIVGVAEQHFRISLLHKNGLNRQIERLVIESHAVFRQENLVLRTALARLSHHGEIGEVYRRHEARSHDHLVNEIRLGQTEGLFAAANPSSRATSLLVLLQGIHNPLLTKSRLEPLVAKDLTRSIVALLEADPRAD